MLFDISGGRRCHGSLVAAIAHALMAYIPQLSLPSLPSLPRLAALNARSPPPDSWTSPKSTDDPTAAAYKLSPIAGAK